MVQTLNFNADAWCLERFDPEFEIHSNKHASCDRRYVIMVDVIIRIMKSYDLLDSNSNHEEVKHTITMSSGEKKKIQPKVISKDVTMRDKS